MVALFRGIAYMAAEAARLVGIVSILFCGIVMGHYTRRNLSAGGRALTMGAFGLMAQLSETFVFIYIGGVGVSRAAKVLQHRRLGRRDVLRVAVRRRLPGRLSDQRAHRDRTGGATRARRVAPKRSDPRGREARR